jgi:hypothetical protein
MLELDRTHQMQNPISNPLFADRQTIGESVAEVAELLALALQRVLTRQSSGESRPVGESSLHISPDQSGDPAAWESGEQR